MEILGIIKLEWASIKSIINKAKSFKTGIEFKASLNKIPIEDKIIPLNHLNNFNKIGLNKYKQIPKKKKSNRNQNPIWLIWSSYVISGMQLVKIDWIEPRFKVFLKVCCSTATCAELMGTFVIIPLKPLRTIKVGKIPTFLMHRTME